METNHYINCDTDDCYFIKFSKTFSKEMTRIEIVLEHDIIIVVLRNLHDA